MTDDRVRALYERALAGAASPGADGPHVEPDELLALVRRDGTEERRLALLDHVMSCDACRRGFELLRAIEVAGATAAAAVPAEKKPQRPLRTFLPLALAASITLVLGVAIVERFGLLQRPEVTRASDDAVTLLGPGAEVAAGEGVMFAWRPVAGALRYELEVLDANDAVTFSTATTDTLVHAANPNLTPGTEYRWWVRAITPGGDVASPARPLRTLR